MMFNFLARFRSVDSVTAQLADLREQLFAVANRNNDLADSLAQEELEIAGRRLDAVAEAIRAERVALRIASMLE